jgi:hypothetical protein
MAKTILRLIQAICVPILMLFSALPVLAHGDEPRLEISVDRINPGAVVELRGVDFEPEESILLALISANVELPMGEALADMEGVFLQIVVLPTDLAEGEYRFRATTDDHEILSPVLLVQGPAVLEEGAEPLREEEDALLAPMPTYAPGVSSTPLPQIVTEETYAPAASSSTAVYSILAGVVLIALVGMRILGKR